MSCQVPLKSTQPEALAYSRTHQGRSSQRSLPLGNLVLGNLLPGP